MDCGMCYGEVLCIPEQDGKESHGVCASCFPAREAEIAALVCSDRTTGRVPHDCLVPEALAVLVGLDVEVLRRLQPRHWVKGVDIVVIGGRQLWRRVSVAELVGELTVNGHLEAAKRLLSYLTSDSSSVVAAQAIMAESQELARRPMMPKNGSWLNSWEEAHE